MGPGGQRLWERGTAAGASSDNGARLQAEIGYGLGVVTPYAGLGLVDAGAWSWRMGARWGLAPAASVGVEGTRYEGVDDDGPDHGLMLRGALQW